MSAAQVTIAVPVLGGEHLVETLASIQGQTFGGYRVVVALDGPDPAAERAVERFLDDPRFRFVVHPERRGWVGTVNALLEDIPTPYWCYQPQDDLLDPRYLETLVAAAEAEPSAAVTYCDIESFGSRDGTIVQPGVTGEPATRLLALLHSHLAAVAFRGLVRQEAIRATGGIPGNRALDFAADTAWLARLARWGDLVRVPTILYRKRYHDANEHLRWMTWTRDAREEAWTVHCVDLLAEALALGARPQDNRLLWLAAVGRAVGPVGAGYVGVDHRDHDWRTCSVERLLAAVRTDPRFDLSASLDAPWEGVVSLTSAFVWRVQT